MRWSAWPSGSASARRTTADRMLAIVPPIAAFVAAGFEHSVANMYFIPDGPVVKRDDSWARSRRRACPSLGDLTWSLPSRQPPAGHDRQRDRRHGAGRRGLLVRLPSRPAGALSARHRRATARVRWRRADLGPRRARPSRAARRASPALLVLAPILRDPVSDPARARRARARLRPGAAATSSCDPELVLVAFLPPLLYSAAFFTSLRDLRANARPISLLAVGLVLADDGRRRGRSPTRSIDGLPWAGGVRARRDRLADRPDRRDRDRARGSACRAGSSRSSRARALINDGTALVAYPFAVAAVVTGSFSFWHGEPGVRRRRRRRRRDRPRGRRT